MKKHSLGAAHEGVERFEISFDGPVLADWRWPLVEIVGKRPGPSLHVMAGMHVNEVSSIEAAIRLQSCFDPGTLRGRVAIMPLVNVPAVHTYTEYNCPIDGKNINFSFPGRPDGSFSEVLAYAILHEWAAGADVLVDLHGGDLRETVSKFVMYQRTGNAVEDESRRAVAMCFDADLVVGLEPKLLDRPGRSCTASAKRGRRAVLVEGGDNGIVDEISVQYHLQGAINVARHLGMIAGPLLPPARARVVCDRYIWVKCPSGGLFYPQVEPMTLVAKGQKLGEVRDYFGCIKGEIRAPESGYVLWRMTQPNLKADDFALGIATPAS